MSKKLFENLLKINYNYLINIIQKIWYENKLKFDLNDSKLFIKVLYDLENWLGNWFSYDMRLAYTIKNIMNFYSVKLYENSIPILKEIIKNIVNNIFTSKDNEIFSYSIKQIIILYKEVFSNYEQIPCKVHVFCLLKVLKFLTYIFIKHLKTEVDKKNINIKNLIIINNSTWRYIYDNKMFILGIIDKTDINSEEAEYYFKENDIKIKYAKIQKKAYKKIELCFSKFCHKIIFKFNYFMNLNVKLILQIYEKHLKKLIEGIDRYSNNNFWFSTLKFFVQNYILFFIKNNSINHENLSQVKNSLKINIEIIEEFFDDKLDKSDLESEIKKLNCLNLFWNSSDVWYIICYINNIILYLDNNFEWDDFYKLLSFRKDFSKHNYDYLKDYFEKSYFEKKSIIIKNPVNKRKVFGNLMYINKFYRNLKQKLFEKKLLLKDECIKIHKNSLSKSNEFDSDYNIEFSIVYNDLIFEGKFDMNNIYINKLIKYVKNYYLMVRNKQIFIFENYTKKVIINIWNFEKIQKITKIDNKSFYIVSDSKIYYYLIDKKDNFNSIYEFLLKFSNYNNTSNNNIIDKFSIINFNINKNSYILKKEEIIFEQDIEKINYKINNLKIRVIDIE